MLLYRAINQEDLKDLNMKKDISCSLVRTNERIHEFISQKKYYDLCKTYYNLCIEGNREFALDIIVSHISGGRLRTGLSPWISTTKDFDFACDEYSVPQAGAYNESNVRKPVILIEKSGILVYEKEIKVLRQSNNVNDIAIDLSNHNLKKLYGIKGRDKLKGYKLIIKGFLSETYNEEMPGYNPVKSANVAFLNEDCIIDGLDNYATVAKEVVFYKQIKNEDIKCIIYPILQDILYGCNINIEKSYNFLITNIDKIYTFLNNIIVNSSTPIILYDDYKTGNNLTDYLCENYNYINGNNIYEKYDFLKSYKKAILNNIILKFNKEFNVNFKLSRLIDDKILVFDFDNPIYISSKQIYDLLVIQKSNHLYKYDSHEKKYISEKEKITKTDIKQLTKTIKKTI